MKVFIVESYPGADQEYADMYRLKDYTIVDCSMSADIIQFTGGEDVTPSFYGEYNHPSTCNNEMRDIRERLIFNIGLTYNIPMVGICRGGQFLNVMCGGKLWQDVNCHAIYSGHPMEDKLTGKSVWVSSTHHQMMRPGEGGEVLGTANEASTFETSARPNSIQTHYTAPAKQLGADVEIVLYKKQKCLCFQPHPEYFGFPECTESFFRHVDNLLKVTKGENTCAA